MTADESWLHCFLFLFLVLKVCKADRESFGAQQTMTMRNMRREKLANLLRVLCPSTVVLQTLLDFSCISKHIRTLNANKSYCGDKALPFSPIKTAVAVNADTHCLFTAWNKRYRHLIYLMYFGEKIFFFYESVNIKAFCRLCAGTAFLIAFIWTDSHFRSQTRPLSNPALGIINKLYSHNCASKGKCSTKDIFPWA